MNWGLKKGILTYFSYVTGVEVINNRPGEFDASYRV